MREAVIVEAVRTPVGKREGALSGWHPVDLLAEVLRAAVERSGIDPARVGDHITGCVSQTGEQAINIARNAWLAAGLPEEVPAVTIDRQCGSSQQAAHFAAQGVMAGVYDLVVASGIEHMTRVPMGITAQQGPGFPFPPSLMDRYEGGLVPQGVSAEIIAERWGLLRQELDEFGARSHELAHAATEEGRFQREILPIKVEGETGSVLFERDEGIRFPVNREKMAALPTPFKDGGVVTAGNSSQISEAFASVVLAWKKELGVGDRWFEGHVNPNGGAIALGHPLGASGAKLMTTLLHELERRDARWGLQVMCEGGGEANATVIERLR